MSECERTFALMILLVRLISYVAYRVELRGRGCIHHDTHGRDRIHRYHVSLAMREQKSCSWT